MVHLISTPDEPSRITDRLWLGTIWSAKKLRESNPGVGLILNCTDETIPPTPTAMTVQLGLLDGRPIPPGKLDYAVRLLQDYFRGGEPRAALVCCHASISRSPAVVLAYLLGSGFGLKEAFSILEQRNPRTLIHRDLLRSVMERFNCLPVVPN